MFPIGQTTHFQKRPYFVLFIIAACTTTFLYQLSLTNEELKRFLWEFALIPRRYVSPSWASEHDLTQFDPLPFMTSMFLHGGFLHIIFNLWTLWIFGRALEDRLGSARYAALYLLSGLAAGLTHALFNLGSPVPTLGASGAIAGVIAAYAVRFPYAWIHVVVPVLIFPFFFSIPAMMFAAVWFLMQILQGVSEMFSPFFGQGIAWWAHIGGFIAGWLLIKPLDRSARDAERRTT
jgi:rhomboid family protein